MDLVGVGRESPSTFAQSFDQAIVSSDRWETAGMVLADDIDRQKSVGDNACPSRLGARVARRHFGTVRRRPSGRWQAIYEHRGKAISAGVFPSKADALSRLSVIEVELRRGTWTDPRAGRITLTDYAEQWLDRRPGLAIRTRELYEYLLSKYIGPSLGDYSITDLTPQKIREWHADLAACVPSTAAKSYRLLSTIMKTAVLDSLVTATPCRVVGAGTEHSDERPVASVEDVALLVAAMPSHLRIVVSLATWCQLLRGEILGLRRCDIDLETSRVNVEQSRTFLRNGSSVVKTPKTRAGRRNIAVPAGVLDELRVHLATFVGSGPGAFVVTNRDGEPVTAMALQRAWTKARDAAGRPDLHLHDLRHAGLTFAAAAGATTAELMLRAGHSSSEAALRYQHATRERDQMLAETLDVLVTKSRGDRTGDSRE